jgi:stage II sporulation protein D
MKDRKRKLQKWRGGLSMPVRTAAVAAVLALGIPAAVLGGTTVSDTVEITELTETEETVPEGPVPEEAAEASPDAVSRDAAVTVSLLTAEGVLELPLDLYLSGVLLAELPSDFAPEAQKAQAVAARTFTLRQMAGEKHPGGALCDDSACCQAWQDPAGERSSAVQATDGQVLYYDGQLIDATYFSCSGGRTEDAVAVWGTDVPYLQAVDSPGEEAAPRYTETVTVPLDDFRAALPACDLSGDPAGWFGAVTYTAGGGVETLEIGGVAWTGTELRQRFSLRSTCFTVAVTADAIELTTLGYGHRVGLSQYGADAMARQGCDYVEILQHYYTGVTVAQM